MSQNASDPHQVAAWAGQKTELCNSLRNQNTPSCDTASSITVDPEFRDLIPPLSDDEYKGLESSLLAQGCHTAIVIWDGTIVDGHNRYELCTRHGIHFDTVSREFSDRRDARIWIIRNQFDRRNLTAPARMDLALLMKSEIQAQAQERQRAGISDPSPKSDEGSRTDATLAKMAGVGKTKLREYESVRDTATPELLQATRDGKVSVHTAAMAAATLTPAEQTEALAAPEPAKAIKAHVSNNSGNNEWYTPAKYIEVARAVMGSIDCDPASCKTANKTVGAITFYDAKTNGLKKPWNGNVWLNPPYAQPLIDKFSSAVVDKYKGGEINQAIVLVNNATETAWCQRMMRAASAVCFPRGRIRFVDLTGKPSGAPLQGQVFIYFGKDPESFGREFSQFGKVWR